MNEKALLIGGVSALSVGVGLAVGYFAAKKELEKQYADLATQEIEEARTHYARLYKRDEFSTPQAAVRELIPDADDPRVIAAAEALISYKGETVHEVPKTEAKVIVQNVFQQAVREVDETKPHVITEDEYMANDNSYDQISLTYYQGDKVLTDTRDEPIPDIDAAVGEANMLGFDQLSEDEHILYVRNNRLKVDFEVQRSTGKYAEEVLGLGSR